MPEGCIVFIVEDDEPARHSLAESLKALGCSVRMFESCESFLAEVDRLGMGCLLLDYHFDGLSGLDLLDRLKERDIFVPTVLFTGRFGSFLKKRVTDYPEVVAVLEKPLDARPVVDALVRAHSLLL